MVIWKRFLYLLSSPLTFRKSSCSKASRASSTLSHILASIWPQRSARVRARYGSPLFLGFTCFVVTTKLEVMTLFSKRGQSERKKSFIDSGGRARVSKLAAFAAFGQAYPKTARFFSSF